MKILYLRTDWSVNETRLENNSYGGVGYYRVIKPAEYLNKQYDDIDIDVMGKDFGDKRLELVEDPDNPTPQENIDSYKEMFAPYDLVVVKSVDNIITAQLIVRACRENDMPFAVDLDDNHFELREDNPAYNHGYNPGDAKRGVVGALLSFSSGIFTSTKPLADYYSKMVKDAFDEDIPAFVLPNCNDINDWQMENGESEGVRIGWHGSTSHNPDLEMIAPALNRILTEYDNVTIEFVGGLTMESFANFDQWTQRAVDSMVGTGGTSQWEGFPELIMSRGWDIGIAPLIDDEFNRGKSHIKWMEYSMKGIPTIASAVYPYTEAIRGTDVVRDGDTGLLVGEDDWEDAMRDLIENEEARKRIGTKAHNYIKEKWQYEDHVDKWYQAIKWVIEHE